MTLPTYNAIQFHSKEEHLSHLYDACMKIAEIKGEEFCFDSIDREQVRDLLISKYNLKFPTK